MENRETEYEKKRWDWIKTIPTEYIDSNIKHAWCYYSFLDEKQDPTCLIKLLGEKYHRDYIERIRKIRITIINNILGKTIKTNEIFSATGSVTLSNVITSKEIDILKKLNELREVVCPGGTGMYEILNEKEQRMYDVIQRMINSIFLLDDKVKR